MASSMVFYTSVALLCLFIITPVSTADLCKWYGIAPFCFIGNSCPDGCFKTLESNKGDGFPCWFSVKKHCCCPKRALDSIINKLVSSDKK
ncbi:unnamed protein product [Adineta steineri]|uniref:Uncharacterized protein n=1 Tax=Adineta steineri TaxID=433720 RepID=A0A819VQB2_9BILA|nr:unnamed protein product [Adineta steineri]